MTYPNISKQVGWNEQSSLIPTDKELDIIIIKAESGCVEAFAHILRINRFAISNMDNIDIISKNNDAYMRLKKQF